LGFAGFAFSQIPIAKKPRAGFWLASVKPHSAAGISFGFSPLAKYQWHQWPKAKSRLFLGFSG